MTAGRASARATAAKASFPPPTYSVTTTAMTRSRTKNSQKLLDGGQCVSAGLENSGKSCSVDDTM